MTTQNPLEETKESPSRERPWILVADDDQEMRSLLTGALRSDGFNVSEAKDGQELLTMLVERKGRDGSPIAPDLVVTDVRMPGATGLRVLSHVRRAHPGVPVILVTAFGSAELYAQARRLGAATVLDKPLSVQDLLAQVRRLVSPCGQAQLPG